MAYAIAADGAILRAVVRVLAPLTYAVSARRQAVRGTKLGRLATFALSISTRGRTIPGTGLRRLVEAAEAVSTATTIHLAVLDILSALTLAVAARGQAVLRTRTAVRTVLVQAADTVPAPAAIHRARSSVFDVNALAVTTRTEADQFVFAGHAFAGHTMIVQCARIVIIARLAVIARDMEADSLRIGVHRARVAVITGSARVHLDVAAAILQFPGLRLDHHCLT